jgi:hypothetical protein
MGVKDGIFSVAAALSGERMMSQLLLYRRRDVASCTSFSGDSAVRTAGVFECLQGLSKSDGEGSVGAVAFSNTISVSPGVLFSGENVAGGVLTQYP